jgi:hypothetical protein
VANTQITVPEIVVRIPAHAVIGTIAAAPALPAGPPATRPEEEREKDAAGDRNDFIKRLFAVAISVGFASHIDQLKWMATLSPPNQKTAQASALLIVAMLTTVLSWEGYLTSLRDRPLLDRTRFFIDIIIVFEYLILLTLYELPNNFALWLCVIFATYVLWDYVRILMTAYISTAGTANRYGANGWFSAIYPFVWGLFSRYDKAEGANRDLYKGPSITFFWWIYFIVLTKFAAFSGLLEFWISVFAIAYGVIMYRVDKEVQFHIWTKLLFAGLPIVLLGAVGFACRRGLLPLIGAWC